MWREKERDRNIQNTLWGLTPIIDSKIAGQIGINTYNFF